MSEVLVTGGSGFIATHVILQLLAAGHRVRATLRSLARQNEVRATLARGGAVDPLAVSFHAADLTRDDGWRAAAAGCHYVLHIASPLPDYIPKDENELIVPARDGTLRVLRAARDAGVKRVVLTSSFSAVAYGHGPREAPFDETDWTDLDGPDVQPYPRSKTMAERAAWEFLASEGGALELATICPVAVLGPVLGPDFSPSIALVQALMQGRAPVAPRIHLGLVDVRDVADLHLRAMTDPAAKSERFLAVAGPPLSILEIAAVLRRRMGEAGRRTPRLEMPNWLARIVALGVPQLRDVKPLLGLRRAASGDKARRLLGWHPRPNDEIIVATAESLLKLGLVRP
ncbi:aldehyde reductase [Bradyrhizobium sp. STM 3809]|uniref:SDR family oxidoreductase n=1 Tax=Bradyrhizobium sp. STM 3809 TaxID=551936 RepID=UPI0002408358|nr:aldehyde reductase [Bradyrhizobium sp. STM 3809]CCD99911.1 putative dihydrokaempferol 4-reductase (NAD-dependent epimerase/dehydratase) [Bradyrhizobium sp. STM 3809]